MVDHIRILLIDWIMTRLDSTRQRIAQSIQNKEMERLVSSAGMSVAIDGDTYVVRNVRLHQISELKRCILRSEEHGHGSATTSTLLQLLENVTAGNYI